ncbi:MAG: Na+/H+ antiporter subunit E [Thermococci archaeon]|nr:Na+/H+ antiporter subunit E [Thermococci archaeon]
MSRKRAGFAPVAILTFVTYMLFTGSAHPYDVVTGVIVAVVVGALLGSIAGSNVALNPVRCFWALVYFVWYSFVAEVKAHVDVMRRVITGDVNPGIVRVPISLRSPYARTIVANSITNTPGTVVVDTDEEFLYVNWIDVRSTDPSAAREEISKDFERFARRIAE